MLGFLMTAGFILLVIILCIPMPGLDDDGIIHRDDFP